MWGAGMSRSPAHGIRLQQFTQEAANQIGDTNQHECYRTTTAAERGCKADSQRKGKLATLFAAIGLVGLDQCDQGSTNSVMGWNFSRLTCFLAVVSPQSEERRSLAPISPDQRSRAYCSVDGGGFPARP